MVSHIARRIQFLILVAVLAAQPAPAQDDDGFRSAGDFPWVGWVGPLSDGLHGLRFGMTGFEANRVMREKGLEPANARPFTLRFEGDVLGRPAELMSEFTTSRPSDPGTSLRVVQIRWRFRGLPGPVVTHFGKLERMLASRYGTPVLSEEDGLNALEAGSGTYKRLYYGPQAKAWLELSTIRIQEFAVLIRIECPQLPAPKSDRP